MKNVLEYKSLIGPETAQDNAKITIDCSHICKVSSAAKMYDLELLLRKIDLRFFVADFSETIFS